MHCKFFEFKKNFSKVSTVKLLNSAIDTPINSFDIDLIVCTNMKL